MKNLIIALMVLAVVGIGAYYLVFYNGSNGTLNHTSVATGILVTNTPEQPTAQSSIMPTTTPMTSVLNTPKTAELKKITVDIKNFLFNPSVLNIKVGTKVTWVNNDSVSHTVTSDFGNLLNSSTLDPGQSFSFTFTSAGIINYHCAIHPTMKGTVVVN